MTRAEAKQIIEWLDENPVVFADLRPSETENEYDLTLSNRTKEQLTITLPVTQDNEHLL